MKAGKVSLEVIELMVHEQIRQSVKEFITRDKLQIFFLERDICPFDRIHLLVHESLSPDIVKASKAFIAKASLFRRNKPRQQR